MKTKYENWTKKIMDSWKELDYERTLETLDKNVKYYENPIDEPCKKFFRGNKSLEYSCR